MTGRNPNVFYETGYAHALGQTVILITKKGEDIPFDLKHYTHIIYKNISELKIELEKRIRWIISNPREPLAKADNNLEFYIDGIKIEDNPIIQGTTTSYGLNLILKIDYHNASDQEFPSPIRIGVITPKEVKHNYSGAKDVTLPDQRIIHIIEISEPIYPGTWDSFELNFHESQIHIFNSGLVYDFTTLHLLQ